MSERETNGHRHTHILIILLSALVGAAVTLVVLYGRGTTDPVQPVEAQADATQLETAFVKIATEAKPAVVNITAKGAAGPMEPEIPEEWKKFFEDPFFFPFRRRGEGENDDEQAPRFRAPGISMGSGWIYSEDGYIVTNSHVIRGATTVKVRLFDRADDEREYDVKVVGNDPRSELALLKIEAGRKLPALKLGDSKTTRVGEWAIAVGSPFQLEQTVTVGVISAKGRFISGQSQRFRIGDIIQTDAAINPGNSGGPLLNLAGEVIGVNVAIVSGGLPANAGVGFAIPSDTVAQVIPVLQAEGKVARGWLGVAIEDLSENERDFYKVPEGGVLVSQVRDDGPAQGSDLQPEDVIVSVDGERVEDTWGLQKAIAGHRPGEEVTLGTVRQGKEMSVKIKLGDTPAAYAGVEEIEEPEKPENGEILGLVLRSITPEVAEEQNLTEKSGVYVHDIAPDSEAAEKGLLPNDAILKVNTVVIKTVDDVKTAIEAAKKAGAKYVILRVSRLSPDGEQQIVTIDLDPNK
jgi:serine protease Do